LLGLVLVASELISGDLSVFNLVYDWGRLTTDSWT